MPKRDVLQVLGWNEIILFDSVFACSNLGPFLGGGRGFSISPEGLLNAVKNSLMLCASIQNSEIVYDFLTEMEGACALKRFLCRCLQFFQAVFGNNFKHYCVCLSYGECMTVLLVFCRYFMKLAG